MLMMRLTTMMAALLLAGCRSLEDPASAQETRLIVHGVLDPHTGDQTVLVYRARTGLPKAIEAHGVSDDEPVAEAQVSIVDPNGAKWVAGRFGDQSGACCIPGIYVFQRAPLGGLEVTPGGTYTLRIQTPAAE